jgi:hypothetical protein
MSPLEGRMIGRVKYCSGFNGRVDLATRFCDRCGLAFPMVRSRLEPTFRLGASRQAFAVPGERPRGILPNARSATLTVHNGSALWSVRLPTTGDRYRLAESPWQSPLQERIQHSIW